MYVYARPSSTYICVCVYVRSYGLVALLFPSCQVPLRSSFALQLRKAADHGPGRKSKEQQQEELSKLCLMAISEGHVACLRVITDSCSEQVVFDAKCIGVHTLK